MFWTVLLVACKGPSPTDPPPAEPGPLMVGIGTSRNPAPVGIGTAGYGGFGVSAEPSPFAEIYPATNAFHLHPDFRAIAISRGEGFEVVLLRTDTVGVFQQLRRAVVLEVLERTGRDLDHALVIGATHTHSGPGRIVDGGGPYDLITDRFFPEFYERVVDRMADAVEAALDDLKPGRVGYTITEADGGINDRRCEDGRDYVKGDLPLIAVEQEGTLAAVQLAYPIHGTVLGIDDLFLSQDVSGAIESAVALRFDHPVQVQMFNSWGADMSPGDPPVPARDGAEQFGGFDRMEHVGIYVADAVEAALDGIAWQDEPTIAMHTWRVPIDRESIGYDAETFNYPYGAVYCSGPTGFCTGTERFESLDNACVPFPAQFSAPTQTELSSGRIGSLYFTTFPGEPGTLLAEQIIDGIRADHPDVEDVAFFGYSQDYLGYSILEDDWWNGGYEASGALWGPKQGAYLAERTQRAFGWTRGDTPDPEPAIITPFDTSEFVAYSATAGIDVGNVLVDVTETAAPADVLEFTVSGNDPWEGPPVATLVDASGAAVLARNGLPITSDGVGFTVRLTPEPSYADAPDAGSRTFRWQFSFPVRHRQDVGLPELAGSYRFQVDLPDGTSATTRTFTVSTP